MRRRPLLLFVSALAAVGGLVAAALASASVGGLRQGIQAAQQREGNLAANLSSASQLITVLTGQQSVLAGRVADVQSQLASDRLRLVALTASVARQRVVSARLHRLFARDRSKLAGWLVAVYEDGRPDGLDVVMTSHGFNDLLDRISFLKRLSNQGALATHQTLLARNAATHALIRLRGMASTQAQATTAAAMESRALQSIQVELAGRQAAVAKARALEVAELSHTRAQEASMQAQLHTELAALATPTTIPGSVGPAGSSFTIPSSVVQCESGGQDLSPNSAGASGYYQILPSTWKEFGGSTSQAYQAPKSEQDQVASRIWNGGSGASNWVCAGLVGAG